MANLTWSPESSWILQLHDYNLIGPWQPHEDDREFNTHLLDFLAEALGSWQALLAPLYLRWQLRIFT